MTEREKAEAIKRLIGRARDAAMADVVDELVGKETYHEPGELLTLDALLEIERMLNQALEGE